MSRQINYIEVAREIRRYVVTNPNRINVTTFAKALKKYINGAEAKALFKYYVDDDKVFIHITTYHYRCTCHQEHFSPDAVRDIFITYPIQSRFGRAKKVEEEAAVVVEAPVQEPIKEVVEEPAKEPTLEELISQKQKELDVLYHQKAVADAKKALAVILEFAGMSVDKLVEIIKLASE